MLLVHRLVPRMEAGDKCFKIVSNAYLAVKRDDTWFGLWNNLVRQDMSNILVISVSVYFSLP